MKMLNRKKFSTRFMINTNKINNKLYLMSVKFNKSSCLSLLKALVGYIIFLFDSSHPKSYSMRGFSLIGFYVRLDIYVLYYILIISVGSESKRITIIVCVHTAMCNYTIFNFSWKFFATRFPF